MTVAKPIKSHSQIFLSCSRADRVLAKKIAAELQKSGLKVVRLQRLESGNEDSLRYALSKSAAMVAVHSRHTDVPASLLFEIGAMYGSEKPVFVIVDRPNMKLPFSVSNLRVIAKNRIEQIAEELLSYSQHGSRLSEVIH